MQPRVLRLPDTRRTAPRQRCGADRRRPHTHWCRGQCNADRDGHVKSADFLDVENFPTLTFASTAVAQQGSNFTVTGDLTIHGVTQSVPVSFDVVGTSTDPWGNKKIGFEGTAEISREAFGLTWNTALETGGVLISDTVKLVLDVEAVKQ